MADALPIEELKIGDLGKKIQINRGESTLVGELTSLDARSMRVTHGRGDRPGLSSVRYDVTIDGLEIAIDPGATFVRKE